MTVRTRRQIGRHDLKVFPVGLGCMGLSGAYGTVTSEDAERLIETAIEEGIDFLDTADFYGRGTNEELVGKCLRRTRKAVAVATKTGVGMGPNRQPILKGRPDQIVAACDASLVRLGVETIDLYLLARADPEVPIEDSVGAMADLVTAGKVVEIGLSEVSASTIRRANAVHPIAALETEYSLAERGVETDILPTLREFDMTLIAYSPFGRGLLAGELDAKTTFDETDFRRFNPRFAKEHLGSNLSTVSQLTKISEKAGASNAQVALAWLLSRGDDIVPIFGTRSIDRLRANKASVSLGLSNEILQELDDCFPPGWARGSRYPESMMALVET